MNDGRQTYEALLSLRRFHQEVALLLATADGLMEELGFRPHPAVGNTANAYGSASINVPKGWSPEFLFRWYGIPEREDLAAFISVLLCPRKPDGVMMNDQEPMVSAGVAHWKGSAPKSAFPYHYARSLWWADVPRDGSFHPQSEERPTESVPQMFVMGLPLATIATSELLRSRVVQPLRDHLVTLIGTAEVR